MQVELKKWGNSTAVRIPASILEASHLHLDQKVEIREEGGRIVIEPLRPKRYDIDDLVAGITDGNRHDAVETGRSAGQEIW